MPKRSLSGARLILTGASSGIGLELARELARRGARQIITARREDRLRDLQHELVGLGGEAVYVAGDITDPDLRRRLLDAARDKLGGLDIVINNAGMGQFGPFREADPARLRRTMEINFFAPIELIRASLPLLETGTRPLIVNVSSVLGYFAMPTKSDYCASKFALHGMNDALEMELQPSGVEMLLVSPSTTATEFFEIAHGEPRHGSSHGMSPARVARGTVRAMERGKREIVFSAGGKFTIWGDRLAPRLMGRLFRRWGV